MKKKRILILTGGGDCPGLNTVIRAIVRAAHNAHSNWEVIGSMRAFHGILETPQDILPLNTHSVAGLQVKGGTILETTNKGKPTEFPVQNDDGTWTTIDRSDELIEKLQRLSIYAVINIGGDGSQNISQHLYKKGLNIIGVPKTIDNDLSSTEFTFGFQTAVETATTSVDKLVSTAESHNRVMIAEVMGRDAGWIALYTAVAAGAEIALIPEIPYDINKIIAKLNNRIINGRGFANIVVAEGARPKEGVAVQSVSDEIGYENPVLGGIGHKLMADLKGKISADIRVTILGHIQRGGTPIAFDRVLATQFGVRAFELVQAGKFGHMVTYNKSKFSSIPIKKAVSTYKSIEPDNYLLHTARNMGICMGD
ncbi:MAG: ATP-dependent 6-phosphofructokinase [bacterium]|nr:ATP-dependent 6-phosphofructokinase [bacterium]